MLLKERLQKYSKRDYSIRLSLSVSTFETPVGILVGVADDKHLHFVSFEDSKNLEKKLQSLHQELSCSFVEDEENKVLQKLKQELEAYFDGKLKKFSVPLKITGSEFQKYINDHVLSSSIMHFDKIGSCLLLYEVVAHIYMLGARMVVVAERGFEHFIKMLDGLEVWQKLQEIPYSSTQTYGEFATAMGRDGGARAVGAACGANSHLLLVPCHRLVASASKGGFSCGIDRKHWVLQHEKKHST